MTFARKGLVPGQDYLAHTEKERLSVTYEKCTGAGFAPAFRAAGWQGDAPKSVKVDGNYVPCFGGVVDGTPVLPVPGIIESEKAKIGIGG